MTVLLHSPLLPGTVRARLNAHTAPERSLKGNAFYCRWKKNGEFVLFATTTWGKAAVCALFGRLEQEGTGSKLTARLGLWPWITGLCIYLALFAAFFLMMAAASGDGMLGLIAGLLFLTLAILFFCLRYGIRKGSPKLLDLLKTVCGTN